MDRAWLRRFSVQLGIAAALAVGLTGTLLLSGSHSPTSTPTAGSSRVEPSIRSLRESLKAKGRAHSGKRLDEACPIGEPNDDCLRLALKMALDLDRGPEALQLTEALRQHSDSTEWYGMHAEALVRSARGEEALLLISNMGAKAEDDPFAQYALAHLAYFSQRSPAAKTHLERSTALGRGVAAHILRTLVAFQEGDLATARDESGRALLLEPDNSDAMYNLAVVNQRENQYRQAREGYLRVLRLDPLNADSRYNLALLTREAGASAEARHNLEKLRRIVGSEDPRVQTLDKLLGPAGSATLAQEAEAVSREGRAAP